MLKSRQQHGGQKPERFAMRFGEEERDDREFGHVNFRPRTTRLNAVCATFTSANSRGAFCLNCFVTG